MALTDSLISYWKLDEASGNRSDSHGTNTMTDNYSVGSATGKLGNCAVFNTSGQELTHSSNSDLQVGDIDFTFAFWFYIPSTAALGWRAFVHKWTGSGSGDEYTIYFNAVQKYMSFSISYDGSYSGVNYVEATNYGSLSDNTWYHLVAWHDSVNNQLGLSINGTTANTTSHSTGVYTGTNTFKIGNSAGEAHYIDEVGFWKRVLTSGERTDLYNGGSGLAYPFTSGGVVVTPLLNRVMSPGHIFGGKCLC